MRGQLAGDARRSDCCYDDILTATNPRTPHQSAVVQTQNSSNPPTSHPPPAARKARGKHFLVYKMSVCTCECAGKIWVWLRINILTIFSVLGTSVKASEPAPGQYQASTRPAVPVDFLQQRLSGVYSRGKQKFSGVTLCPGGAPAALSKNNSKSFHGNNSLEKYRTKKVCEKKKSPLQKHS